VALLIAVSGASVLIRHPVNLGGTAIDRVAVLALTFASANRVVPAELELPDRVQLHL
jgi:hypothetical protein